MKLFSKIKDSLQRKKSRTNLEDSKQPKNDTVQNNASKKNSFKKKEVTNETSNVTCYNTNLVPLPKYSKLPNDLKLRVDRYYSEINPEDEILAKKDKPFETKAKKYEALIKYGESLQKKAKEFTKVLMNILNEIINNSKSYSSIKDRNVIFENMITSLINKEKLKYCSKVLSELNEEAILRAVAIDRYAKKESLRKYDFLGIFGRAERLEYLKYQDTLREVVQCSLITITVIQDQLRCVLIELCNEDKYNQSVEMLSRFYGEKDNVAFRTPECTKLLQDISRKVIFEYSLCFDSSDYFEKMKYDISNELDEYDYIVTKARFDKLNPIPLKENEKDSLISHERNITRYVAEMGVAVLVYSLENESELDVFYDQIVKDSEYYDSQITYDAVDNESKVLIDEIKEKALYYHRFLTRIYNVTGLNLYDEDKKIYGMYSFSDFIYLLIGTGNFDFVEDEIQNRRFEGIPGIIIPDEKMNAMLKEYMKDSIKTIKDNYGVDVNKDVHSLTELFLNKRNVFASIINGSILNIPFIKTYFSDSYNSKITSLNYSNKLTYIPKVEGYLLDKDYLSKNLISFFELFEYYEFIEARIHRYNCILDIEIDSILEIAILESPIFGAFSSDNTYSVVDITKKIVKSGIYNQFGYNKDLEQSIGEMNDRKIAFIPRIVKSIKCEEGEELFLPIRYFNKNTTMLYIHDYFDLENSDMRLLFKKAKNLKTILVSKKKYDEIFAFINFPGGQYDKYKFEFLDDVPYGYEKEYIVLEDSNKLYEGSVS